MRDGEQPGQPTSLKLAFIMIGFPSIIISQIEYGRG